MQHHSSASHHHKNAANHHESAARYHRKAAKHYASGDHEMAAHHAHAARGHALFANENANHASKQHAMHEGRFMEAGHHEHDDESEFADEGHAKIGRSGYGRGEENYKDQWEAGSHRDHDDEDEDNEDISKSMRGPHSSDEDEDTGRHRQNGRAYKASSLGGRSSQMKTSKGRSQRGGTRSHAA